MVAFVCPYLMGSVVHKHEEMLQVGGGNAMPKTTKARLLQNLASAFELPEDVVLDLTRITVTGNAQLLMENHKGILTYEPERIRIRTQQGETLITGRNLKIDSLFSSEMRITGSIASIEFVRFRG